MNSKLEHNRIHTYDSNLDGVFDKSAIPSSKGITLIETKDITSNVSAVDFSSGIDSDHFLYIIEISECIFADDGTKLMCRAHNGTSFQSGSSDYEWVREQEESGNTNRTNYTQGDSELELSNEVDSSFGTGPGLTGFLRFYSPSRSNIMQHFQGQFSYRSQETNDFVHQTFSGVYDGTLETISQIRLFPSSGNFDRVTAQLFGYPK